MVTGLSSLALELQTGVCFVLAALLPPKNREKVLTKQHFFTISGLMRRGCYQAYRLRFDPWRGAVGVGVAVVFGLMADTSVTNISELLF